MDRVWQLDNVKDNEEGNDDADTCVGEQIDVGNNLDENTDQL